MSEAEKRLPPAVNTPDRHIPLREWPANGVPRGVVQVLHGLAEHSARYERFARAAGKRGFAVVAHDHRGHGPEYSPDRLGHFADRGGWDKVVADVDAVRRCTRCGYGDVPLILFGHSMGSYIAQSYCMRHPDTIDALVLSGSTWPNCAKLRIARALAWPLAALRGPSSPGTLMNNLSFGKFNERFKPNRTDFDWLSRDDAEVDKYVGDHLCGATSSNRLWFDLLGGLLETSDPVSIAHLPDNLPVLITGGELDPVGGGRALGNLAAKWRKAGKQNVAVKIYPGGRHEVLNETNREEVTDDILDWVDRVVGCAPSPGPLARQGGEKKPSLPR